MADENDGIPVAEAIFEIDAKDLTKLREIGRGAFGKVYLGDYLGTDVAIKYIEPSTGEDEEIEKLLVRREVAILKACRHPNIVTFMGIVKNGPIPEPVGPAPSAPLEAPSTIVATREYKPGERRNDGVELVMEYCPKGDLRHFLKDEETEITWKRRVSMALDIARGMSYLHSRNIIFRDLKARNMLIDSHSRVKIADFGLARHHTDSSRPKTMCGTDGFLAPELILGEDYNHMADVFSFGMVLFEIITRQRVEKAFPRGPIDCFAINEEAVRASNLIPSDCPTQLLDLAFWCTRYEPEERPEFKKIVVALKHLNDTLSKQNQAAKKALRTKSRKGAISSKEAATDANVQDIMKKYAEYQKRQAEETQQALLGNPETIPTSPRKDPLSPKVKSPPQEIPAGDIPKAGKRAQKITKLAMSPPVQSVTSDSEDDEETLIPTSPNHLATKKQTTPRRTILSGSLFKDPKEEKQT